MSKRTISQVWSLEAAIQRVLTAESKEELMDAAVELHAYGFIDDASGDEALAFVWAVVG